MRAVRFILALLAVLLVATPSALAASVNDLRQNALPLASDQISAVDTTGDAIESGEPNTTSGGCQPSGGTGGGALVGATEWYTVIGTGGPITITTDETTTTTPSQSTPEHVDTLLFVYPHGSTTALACNDDIGNLLSDNFVNVHSTVTFSSAAGQEYDVQVGESSTPPQFPPGALIVTAERPVNETSTFATPLTVAGGGVSASDNAADPTDTELCETPDGTSVMFSRIVWFRYHATAPGTATFSAAAGSLQPVEAVYGTASATPLGCDDGHDATVPGTTSVTVPVTPGDYLVRAGGTPGTRGSWTESVGFSAASATTLISSASRTRVARPVTYLASVTPAPSAGTVAFADHGKTIAGCGAVPTDQNTGNATCDVTYSAVGTHSIVATYSGASGGEPGSASNPLTEMVVFAKTATSLSLSRGSRRVGRRVTLTVHVAPAPVGGKVAIVAGDKALRGCRVLRLDPRGVGRCTTRFRRRGTVSLIARYSGSSGYGRSNSRKRTLLVNPR